MKKIEGAAVGRANLVTLFFEDLSGTATDEAAASENDDVHMFFFILLLRPSENL
jgi:hypothetical protein